MNTSVLILIFVALILVVTKPIVKLVSYFTGYWWTKGQMKAIEEEATKTIDLSTQTQERSNNG